MTVSGEGLVLDLFGEAPVPEALSGIRLGLEMRRQAGEGGPKHDLLESKMTYAAEGRLPNEHTGLADKIDMTAIEEGRLALGPDERRMTEAAGAEALTLFQDADGQIAGRIGKAMIEVFPGLDKAA